AVECGANALLESAPGVGKSLYEDLEKLGTLNKFELFALLRGNPLDRGCDIFGKMKEVWKLRNDFFHPKAKELEFVPGQPDRFVERSIGNRNYPTALDALEYVHAVALVGDILRFVSWVLFDVCRFSVTDGGRRISRGITESTGLLVRARDQLGYDIR